MHPYVETVKILPTKFKQLLVEVYQGSDNVDGLCPLSRLGVGLRGHGALRGLHGVEDVGGEQGGQVVGVHLVPHQVLPRGPLLVLAVLRHQVKEVQEDVHRVSVDLENVSRDDE